jgi:hypothetical protein
MVLMIFGLRDPDPPLTSKKFKKSLDFLEPLSTVPKCNGPGKQKKQRSFIYFLVFQAVLNLLLILLLLLRRRRSIKPIALISEIGCKI